MKYSILIMLYFMNLGCASSQSVLRPCKDTFDVTVLKDVVYEGDVLIQDSLRAQLKIAFEQDFNDSVYVFVGDILIQVNHIVTDRLLGVSPQFITIDYSMYEKMPKVSFVLKRAKECVSFYPKRGKQMAYVNYLNGAWSIELSNIMREYR
ncbi:MAG TPA: hypothetical protein VIK74_04840 [Parasegetibacter sp.]